MSGKGMMLMGVIALGCLFGMPQAQASVLDEVMGAETRMVSLDQQDESIAGSVKRHVDRHIKKGMDRANRGVRKSIGRRADGMFRGIFH